MPVMSSKATALYPVRERGLESSRRHQEVRGLYSHDAVSVTTCCRYKEQRSLDGIQGRLRSCDCLTNRCDELRI